MRIALISIVKRCDDDLQTACGLLACGGRSIAERQIELALAAGCERVLCFAASVGNEFTALQGEAERHRVRLEPLQDTPDLVEKAGPGDELLLISDGLFVDAPAAVELLEQGPGVLTLPAERGIPAGFERVDLTRAWAGALVIPGDLVARLGELPPDADPFSALLRIALQARLPEWSLPPEWLDEGCWRLVISDADAAGLEPAWLDRRLPRVSSLCPTRWIAGTALSRSGRALLAQDRLLPGLWGAGGLLLFLALVFAWFGLAPLAFLAIAPALVCFALARNVIRLDRSSYAASDRSAEAGWWLNPLSDLALATVAALTLDGSWYERLFPPVVLIGLLWSRHGRGNDWQNLLTDRGLLATFFAISAAFGYVEPVIMLVALILLALQIRHQPGRDS